MLYRITDWEFLSVRRNRRQLQLFCDIVNKTVHDYLCRLIPCTIQSTTEYETEE